MPRPCHHGACHGSRSVSRAQSSIARPISPSSSAHRAADSISFARSPFASGRPVRPWAARTRAASCSTVGAIFKLCIGPRKPPVPTTLSAGWVAGLSRARASAVFLLAEVGALVLPVLQPLHLELAFAGDREVDPVLQARADGPEAVESVQALRLEGGVGGTADAEGQDRAEGRPD